MNAKEFMKTQEQVGDYLDKLKITIIEDAISVSKEWQNDSNDLDYTLKSLGESIGLLEDFYDISVETELPEHYKGSKDVIAFLEEHFSYDGFVDSMIFNIVKYTTRLGRKDEADKEVRKIKTYYVRLEKHIKYGDSMYV